MRFDEADGRLRRRAQERALRPEAESDADDVGVQRGGRG
jgi:hypothetical protein